MTKKTVYVVPHTHWDHEWYFSEDDSISLLFEALGYALDVLKKDTDTIRFTFDGQTSLIDDYLKLRPDQEKCLKDVISKKKMLVGPWYTQTDTLHVETESIIRNLLIGTREALGFGHCMGIGYLPDIFGQNAYLPTLFNGFGIRTSILQRGVYNDQVKDDLNFVWRSPSGDSVYANNLYFGYGPGKFLSTDPNYLQKSLYPILKILAEMNKHSDFLLLPAGGDQVLIREELPDLIDRLNSVQCDYQFLLSDYETFVRDTLGKYRHQITKVITGELIACQKSRIHQTIGSQRVDIKLAVSRIEEKLYHQLEPLAVLANQFGKPYPGTQIESALKLVLQSEAHDSIAGCNSDETNRTILERLKKSERIIDSQINIIEKQMARAVIGDDQEDSVIAFNLLPKTVDKPLKFVIFTRTPEIALTQKDGRMIPQTIIEQNFISGGKKVIVTALGEKQVEIPGYYRSLILAKISFSGFGYQSYFIKENVRQQRLVPVKSNYLENKFYRIFIENDHIKILNRLNNSERNFFYFEDQPDAGDSYDFSPLDSDQPVCFSKTVKLQKIEKSELCQSMTVTNEWKVSSDLNKNKATRFDKILTVTTKITLIKDSNLVYLNHQLNNTAKDHRVRIIFPNKNNGYSYADQGYSIIKRKNTNPYLSYWKESHFAEAPQSFYPMENFAYTTDTVSSTGVITCGLKEYQSTDSELILTLFRSVGLLGRDDLAWRPGRASGINNKVVDTPDAQMQGQLSFHYVYRWDHTANGWFNAVEQAKKSQLTYQLQTLNSFEQRLERFELPQPTELHHLPQDINLLSVNPNIYVAALKKAEDHDCTVLRVFNPDSKAVELNKTISIMKRMNLDETEQPNFDTTILPKDVGTFEIRL